MAGKTETSETAGKTPTAVLTEADALRAMQQKIRVGLNSEASVDPRANSPSCRACYQRGFLAALKWLQQD